jgi:hypothetical protein
MNINFEKKNTILSYKMPAACIILLPHMLTFYAIDDNICHFVFAVTEVLFRMRGGTCKYLWGGIKQRLR